MLSWSNIVICDIVHVLRNYLKSGVKVTINEMNSKGCEMRTAGGVKEHSILLSVLQGKVGRGEDTFLQKGEMMMMIMNRNTNETLFNDRNLQETLRKQDKN